MVYYYEEFATKEEADAWRTKVLHNYHPMGYGTRLREPARQPDGKWLVTGDRGSSCD